MSNLSGIDRPLLKGNGHPIYTGRYLLSTNEINKVYKTVKRWLDTRAPGGIIYGRPRIGKTRSIYLSQNIFEEGIQYSGYIENELVYYIV